MLLARRNFYSRTRSRHLRKQQQNLLAEYLPTVAMQGVCIADNPSRSIVDMSKWFSAVNEIWLEVGFGSGEHMVHQALNNPKVGIIGCEPYKNGVAVTIGKMRRAGINNIRIYVGDVRDVLDVLPCASIGRVFLLYPDPWPKQRHHRRRFVTPEYLNPLAWVLCLEAEFRIVSDIGDYARQALYELGKRDDFIWLADSCQDWHTPWADWTPTRYELKARNAGRASYYLTFMKQD